jgi:trans-2,3-dihydro-3-hydroxyanthranilate isomerase
LRAIDYFVLDVFTERRLAGNPLAVVLCPGGDGPGITSEMMQAIAKETNLSETTFVERRDAEIERSEGVRVRIFTTDEELPFAGHPTLGTASLLRAIAPECVVENTVKLALKVGMVPVRFMTPDAGAPAWPEGPVRGEMTQRDPVFGEVLDPVEVAKLTGLSRDDFDADRPIQIVSTGTAFAIVPLRSVEALGRLRVSQDEAGAYLRARGARWFYVLASTGAAALSKAGEPTWRARMQFNGGEDPATGSAAGCAISHMVMHGAVASGETVHLRQGVEMGRPSDLYLSARRVSRDEQICVTDVRVGGSTVLVATGQLFLP